MLTWLLGILQYLDAELVSRGIVGVGVCLLVVEAVVFLSYVLRLRVQDPTAETRDPPDVLTSPPSSPLQFAPALLTSLGVIGTFAGITVGLFSFDAGAGADEMMRSVTGLIAGMKTAFATSLVGLGMAAVLMVVLAITNAVRRRRTAARRQEWLAKFRDPDTTRMLELLERLADPHVTQAQRENAAALATAAQQLSEASTGMQASLGAFSAEAVGREVRRGIEGALLPELQKTTAEMRAIREQMERQNEHIVQTLLDQLRAEVIEPLAERIDQSSEATRSAADAVTQLHADLGPVSERLAGAAEQMDIFQRQTLTAMEAFNERLVTELTGTFTQIRTDLEASLKAQADEQARMLAETRAGVVQVLDSAQNTFAEQTRTLTTTGEQAGAVLDRSREALSQTLSGIDSTLQDTRRTVETELERFRVTYQESLDAYFLEQNSLLEQTLGVQREGLHTVVRELQATFEAETARSAERRELADRSLDAVRELQESVAATAGVGMQNVRAAAREVKEQTLLIGARYDHLSTVLDSATEGLQSHLERVDHTYRQQFEQMDSAAAKIHEKLLQSASLLVMAEQDRRSRA
ncbi:MAG: hypothetical protein H6736_22075 [Alphaproteobacteria bacterium]|nr:hypothetical protein [Alphaproteobacteria bacterium]